MFDMWNPLGPFGANPIEAMVQQGIAPPNIPPTSGAMVAPGMPGPTMWDPSPTAGASFTPSTPPVAKGPVQLPAPPAVTATSGPSEPTDPNIGAMGNQSSMDKLMKTLQGVKAPASMEPPKVSTPGAPSTGQRGIQGGQLMAMLQALGAGRSPVMPLRRG